MVYRGRFNVSGREFRDTSTWKIRKIRKNRKPKDTPPYLQAIVDGMATNFETDYPLRSESKFGGGSYRKGELKGYGDLKVCFPLLFLIDIMILTLFFRTSLQKLRLLMLRRKITLIKRDSHMFINF